MLSNRDKGCFSFLNHIHPYTHPITTAPLRVTGDEGPRADSRYPAHYIINNASEIQKQMLLFTENISEPQVPFANQTPSSSAWTVRRKIESLTVFILTVGFKQFISSPLTLLPLKKKKKKLQTVQRGAQTEREHKNMFVFSRNGNRRGLIGCVSEPRRRLISARMARVAPCQTFSGRSCVFPGLRSSRERNAWSAVIKGNAPPHQRLGLFARGALPSSLRPPMP